MATPPVGIGELIAGKYLVERVIGEGGMGMVLAAHHRELDRRVAIKFLLPEIAEQGMAAERFRREARSSARIRGENVCRVLDVGTLESGVPFMVMEYLEGHDLSSELEARGKLPYTEAIEFILQACEAVAAAHAAGVIHRDLKPANLFIENCGDGSRRIKVLDFGVSKSVLDATPSAHALTKTSSLVGSPLYMSPEQLDSAKAVDPRTDIWSLGIVLYELIAGCTPFVGESIAQLVAAVLHDSPRRIADHGAIVPPLLEAVMVRALSKSRDGRYASVADFAHALVPFASPQAAQAAARISRLLSLSMEPSAGPVNSPAPSAPSEKAATNLVSSTPVAWAQTEAVGARKQRTLLVGAALLGVCAVLFLGLRWFGSGEPVEPPAGADSSARPVAAPLQPSAAGPTPATDKPVPSHELLAAEPAQIEHKPLQPALEPALVPGLGVPDAGSVAARPSVVERPAPEPSAERSRGVRREPERRAPSEQVAPRPAASNLSDFGGRR